MPSVVDGEIVPYTSGGESTTNVINSNATECSFKVLNELGEINHYIENGVNKFKFNHVQDATDYIVLVNGQALSANKFSVDTSGDKTILSLPNLKNIEDQDVMMDANQLNWYYFLYLFGMISVVLGVFNLWIYRKALWNILFSSDDDDDDEKNS